MQLRSAKLTRKPKRTKVQISVGQLYQQFVNGGGKALLTCLGHPSRMAKDMAKELAGEEHLRPSIFVPATPGVQIPVQCLDVRLVWGNRQVLVKPVGGVGTVWINAHNLKMVKEWPDESKESLAGGGPQSPV